jgi:o-succinylbenzoate synthase
MTIKDFKYSPFSLKFSTPFQTSTQLFNVKEGFIISLTDDLGNVAVGECSPLSGFSSETITDTERILKGLRFQLPGFSLEETISSITEFLSEFVLVPSLRFALEQVFISLMIKRNSKFLDDNFGKVKSEIPINAIIGFDYTENILLKIDKKIKLGFETFKIKIGRDNFEEDYELVQTIRNKFGNGVNLRLDANGKWNNYDCLNYLERLSTFNIQYIEDPTSEIDSLIEISENSSIPIAVDEPLKIFKDVAKIINYSNIKFIILKPMIFGGIISSIQLIKEAEDQNKNIIISSSFESAIGKSVLVLIAAHLHHTFAHGLDTNNFFIQDIDKDSFSVKNGKIYFNENAYPPKYNLSKP